MPVTAVLFDAPPPPLAAEPLRVGGLAILERQVRQIRRAGIAKVVVVARDAAVVLPGGTGDVLVIEPGIVLDEHILRAVLAATAPAVATWPAATIAGAAAGTERLDAASSAAGIGLYPAPLVETVIANLGGWDFASTLRRAALAGGAARIDLAVLAGAETKAGPRARAGEAALIWARPGDAAAAAAATASLAAAARETPDDWPGRLINAPVAARVAGRLAPTPVTPAMATLFVVILAFAATLAFAAGALWTGLLLAVATGMLDGTDRVLARVRLDPARPSERLRPLIAAADTAWFAAIGIRFAVVQHSAGPLAVAALIIGFAHADRLQEVFFRRLTGTRLAAAGRAERRLRLLGAGRDARVWAWLPFAAAGAWHGGLIALAAYTAVTFFAAQRRIFIRVEDRA